MNNLQIQSPRRASGTTLFALAMGALLVLAGVEAKADPTGAATGARAGNSGRMAQSSIAGANRTSNVNRNNNVNVNKNNNVNVNKNNNVNINHDHDVNIDVDVDHDYGWNYPRYPVAAGVVIGAVAVTHAARVGAYYYALPPTGCTIVVKNGISYHYCGSVYYQRSWYGNDVVYVVVNP